MVMLRPAPEWIVSHALNAPGGLALGGFKGRVVLLVAFQMLCPGCVSFGLPQAVRARAVFDESDLAVVGLHTVFEHHAAQGSKEALAAFLHEYRIGFPVGIDAPAPDGGVPLTMRAYNMQGTPTTILIDRAGRIRLQKFGHLDDMALGAHVATLIGEAPLIHPGTDEAGCSEEGCPAPS